MNTKKMIPKIFEKREVVIALLCLVIMVAMGVSTSTFFSVSNLMSVALSFCADGFAALAMTGILIGGQIDLSVGSMMCLSSMIVGKLNFLYGVPIWGAVAISLIICVCIGFVTGFLISKFNIESFIITLGMQGVLRGVCNILSTGSSIPLNVSSKSAFRFIGSGYIGPVPCFFVIFLITMGLLQFLLRRSQFFSKVYFIGSNQKAAELAGVNVNRTKITLYMISAFLAATAGILSTSRFGVGAPTLGIGAEGRAITAAVVGGTAFEGGRGSMVGTFLGLVLVQLINNGVIHLHISTYWQDFVSNMLLIIVIVIDAASRFKKHGIRFGFPLKIKK